MIDQGGVYAYDLGPQQGALKEGKRYLIVVQNDTLNNLDGYNNVIVVPTTTKMRPSPTFAKIEPSAENGLTATSYAICNQIQTFDKSRLVDFRGKLSKVDLYAVKEALKIALGIT